jgi:SAM-dependent methyltransferase
VPIDLDEYRKASLESWDRIAANWEAEREFIQSSTGAVSRRMVDALDAGPGDTILDIASGTGDLGYLTLDRIGPEGKLISTDFAAGMVDGARRNSEQLGLENVAHRVLDAESMDLPDDSVDGVLCRFGYMLMADPAAALAETRRVLKDGSRLVFAVWATPAENLWAFIPGRVMVERGHLPPPEPGAPGIFAMGDPARIHELVTGAGFGEPEIEQVEVAWPYGSAETHWDMTLKLAGPLAEVIQGLQPGERDAIREEVRSRIEPLLGEGGGLIPGVAHIVLAS